MRKVVFWLLILGILVYSGFQFAQPYYKYLVFQSEAKEIARTAVENEEKIKDRLFEKAMELKMPIGRTDLEVTRKGNVLRIKTSWFEVVDIFGVYKKTLTFTVDTTR